MDVIKKLFVVGLILFLGFNILSHVVNQTKRYPAENRAPFVGTNTY